MPPHQVVYTEKRFNLSNIEESFGFTCELYNLVHLIHSHPWDGADLVDTGAGSYLAGVAELYPSFRYPSPAKAFEDDESERSSDAGSQEGEEEYDLYENRVPQEGKFEVDGYKLIPEVYRDGLGNEWAPLGCDRVCAESHI
jgi:hypothetical protein